MDINARILRLKGVREREIRIALVREAVLALPPRSLIAFVASLAELCLLGEPPGEDAMLAFIPSMMDLRKDEESYEPIKTAYILARELEATSRGFEARRAALAGRLLLEPPPKRLPPRRMQRFAVRWDRDVSLGERKAMASGGVRQHLEKLIYDADRQVVARLCKNPRLLEQDLLLIATRRPISADLLEEVARSVWLNRYQVRHALAHNPYNHTGMVMRILPMLHDKHLRALSFAGDLHTLTHVFAKELIAHRGALLEGGGLSWLQAMNNATEEAEEFEKDGVTQRWGDGEFGSENTSGETAATQAGSDISESRSAKQSDQSSRWSLESPTEASESKEEREEVEELAKVAQEPPESTSAAPETLRGASVEKLRAMLQALDEPQEPCPASSKEESRDEGQK